MALEDRNGRIYYYRSHRIGKRVRKEYVAAGEGAMLIAELEAIERDQKNITAMQLTETRQMAREVFAIAAEFDRLADQVFRVVMQLTGHTLHKRCEWRRKRRVKPMLNLNDLLLASRKAQQALVVPVSPDPEVQRILDQAAEGDTSVLPAVKKLLTDRKQFGNFGSVAAWAQSRLVRVAAGNNLVLTEALNKRLAEHVETLLADCGPNPTLLEKMAATRVAHNWLTVHILEVKWEQFDAESKQAEAIDKQLCRVERRLHAAIKSFATLRRLRKPMVIAQLNIANGSTVKTLPTG